MLDTPAFIYYLEEGSPYRDGATAMFQRIQAGRIKASASTLVLTELLVPFHRRGDHARAGQLRDALEGLANLQFIPVDIDVASRAASVRAIHGLHTPDAIHVATALDRRADWLVTNDSRLRRVASDGVRIWLFDDHV